MFSQSIESNLVNGIGISKGSKFYYARIMPDVGVCYVQTLIVRTIYEERFVGMDEMTKTAHVISNKFMGTYVFDDIKAANKVVKEAQKDGKIRTLREIDNE